MSIMSEHTFRKIPPDLRPRREPEPYGTIFSVNGEELAVKGVYAIPTRMAGRQVLGYFYVVRNAASATILGTDFITEHGLSFDAVSGGLFFSDAETWQAGSLLCAAEVTPVSYTHLTLPTTPYV